MKKDKTFQVRVKWADGLAETLTVKAASKEEAAAKGTTIWLAYADAVGRQPQMDYKLRVTQVEA